MLSAKDPVLKKETPIRIHSLAGADHVIATDITIHSTTGGGGGRHAHLGKSWEGQEGEFSRRKWHGQPGQLEEHVRRHGSGIAVLLRKQTWRVARLGQQ